MRPLVILSTMVLPSVGLVAGAPSNARGSSSGDDQSGVLVFDALIKHDSMLVPLDPELQDGPDGGTSGHLWRKRIVAVGLVRLRQDSPSPVGEHRMVGRGSTSDGGRKVLEAQGMHSCTCTCTHDREKRTRSPERHASLIHHSFRQH